MTAPHGSFSHAGVRRIILTVTKLRTKRRDLFGLAGVAALKGIGRVGVIDTHVHFYDPGRPQGVPWPGKDERLLYRTVLPREYEALARPLGVTGVVVVEASPWVEDNHWVLDLAAHDPFLLGLVGHLDPGSPEFRDHFERFRRNPLFLGIRVNDRSVSDALTYPDCAADFIRLADAGLETDILGSASADLVRFVDRFHDLRIVIDHLPFAPGAEGTLTELGRRPNVFAKVSGVLRRVNGRVPTDLAFYRAALDQLWDVFGPDRLIYGSNWPVSDLVAPLTSIYKVVVEYFTEKGPVATDKFFRQNSRTAYRWKARS